MLAIVSIVFISIPLYRILWRKYNIKNEDIKTAQIKKDGKGRTKIVKKQMEEKPTQKDKIQIIVAKEIYPNIAQTISDSIPAIDSLQIQNTLDNIHIAETKNDSIVPDTTRWRN